MSTKLRKRLRHRPRIILEAIEPRRLLSTVYVDVNSAGSSHNGTSWGTAYLDLQQALAAAVSGDQIRVADGTYRPTDTTDRTISFELKTGVSLVGGYAGFGAANPDERNVSLYPSVLSGDIG